MPRPQSHLDLESARSDLVEKRAQQAILFGIPLYGLNALEPWFDYHDVVTVWIQLGTTFILICLAAITFTPFGSRHRLKLFTFGFLISVVGFEIIVCYKHAFGTSYADGFPTLYAFYCVLIPTTIRATAIMGIVIAGLLAAPEVAITRDLSRLGTAIISDLTTFLILLYGRHLANSLWEREYEASHLYAEFVSQLSHDLRTPLAALCLLTERLQSGKVLDEARSEYYRFLAQKVQRLRFRIDDLLQFAQMEAGIAEYRFLSTSLSELVRDIAPDIEQTSETGHHKIVIREEQDLPPVRGDRAALTCVLSSLLDNAVKYSPRSSEVVVDLVLEDKRIVVRVKDSGIGIPESEQSEIFSKFFRGSSARKSAIPGTGLGLALVQRIVKAHQGEITVTSKTGQGSTFTILLPAMDDYEKYPAS